MRRNLTLGIFTLVIAFIGLNGSVPMMSASATAAGSAACTSLDQQLGSGQGCGTSSTSGTATFNNTVANIINVFSIVVGIIIVFMVILAGFQFITSGGDSNGVSKAKNALFYAMIGLLIVALAQFLVRFVLSTVGA